MRDSLRTPVSGDLLAAVTMFGLAGTFAFEGGNWAESLGWHNGRKYGEKTGRNNWMRIGLAIARTDCPAATPSLTPNISPFWDRPFSGNMTISLTDTRPNGRYAQLRITPIMRRCQLCGGLQENAMDTNRLLNATPHNC